MIPWFQTQSNAKALMVRRSARKNKCQLLCPAALFAAAMLACAGTPAAAASIKQGELFRTTNVWTIHLKFTLEQWQAMEPKQDGPGFFGGGPGGGRGPGGPGGPGRPGGGGFGPGMFLAPGFLEQGDQDHDGQLTRDEFR